jgi:hypothetical protein
LFGLKVNSGLFIGHAAVLGWFHWFFIFPAAIAFQPFACFVKSLARSTVSRPSQAAARYLSGMFEGRLKVHLLVCVGFGWV